MKPTPLPTPDADSAPFWEACRAGRLAAQRCPVCSRFRWPPMAFCPWCHHRGGDWVDLPGTGTVTSFVIVDRAFDPAFEDRVPYVVAHIALDGADAVTLVGNVVVEPVESVFVGLAVSVSFREANGAILPEFRPVAPSRKE